VPAEREKRVTVGISSFNEEVNIADLLLRYLVALSNNQAGPQAKITVPRGKGRAA
jgi:hypothetical protein